MTAFARLVVLPLLLLLGVLPRGGNVVLCAERGDAAHMSVEWGGCCAEPVRPAAACQQPDCAGCPAHDAEGCGDCVDVPLADDAWTRVSDAPAPPALAPAAAACAAAVAAGAAAAPSVPAPADPGRGTPHGAPLALRV